VHYSKAPHKRPRREDKPEYPAKRRALPSAVVVSKPPSHPFQEEPEPHHPRGRADDRENRHRNHRENDQERPRYHGSVRDDQGDGQDEERRELRERRGGRRERADDRNNARPEEIRKRLTSAIVHANPVLIDEKPRPSVDNSKERQRNKKIFGLLLGTLQRFHQESSTQSEKEQKRKEVEEKVQSQVVEEHTQMLDKQRSVVREEKEKQQTLREELLKEIEEKEMQFMNSKWERHRNLLANPRFRKTVAVPCIYYVVNDDSNASAQEADKEDEDEPDHDAERDGDKDYHVSEVKNESADSNQTGEATEKPPSPSHQQTQETQLP